MSKQRAMWLVITVIIATVLPLSAAPLTNIWSFTLPFQYVASGSSSIEVIDGAARLKLQPCPWVAPANGCGCPFLGNLVGFTHRIETNNSENEVRYQISGNDGTNWYAWGDSKWSDVSAFSNSNRGWQFANEAAVIHENIGSFCTQVHAKTGGVFKFKAFLKYDGISQVVLREVRLMYAPGRLVVTVPNGLEVGQDAWLIGVPYMVQWTSTGKVGSKLKLEYSLDSGATWALIATNVVNMVGKNNYSHWRTPISVSDKCRVRVTDMEDASINDLSDSDFSLAERFRVLAPNGGEASYVGKTNAVRWASPY